MTTSAPCRYDVLLLESHPHAGDQAAERLTAAGHHVHRCHEPGGTAPCSALDSSGRCPIDDGIDVAVLVRRPLEPAPTQHENGATCALRAGIPIVEQGPERPDPWDPWVTVRLTPDNPELVLVTEGAARQVDAPARAAIRRAISRLLRSAGIDEQRVECRVDRTGSSVAVDIALPEPADRALRSAISVRALDGLRAASTKTLGNVDVYVHPSAERTGG